MFNKNYKHFLSIILRYAANFLVVVSLVIINFSGLSLTQVKAAPGDVFASGFSGPFGMAFDDQ